MNVNRCFSDYDTFTEHEITNITHHGILLKNDVLIEFKTCAKNYKEAHSLEEKTLCIGERDITDLSFTFYTSPKPIMIKFIEKNKFAEFFSKCNTRQRFHELQKKVNEYGYKTFDMS